MEKAYARFLALRRKVMAGIKKALAIDATCKSYERFMELVVEFPDYFEMDGSEEDKPTENLSQEEIDSVLQRYMSKVVMQQIMNGIANNAIRFFDTLDGIAHIEDAVEQLIEQSVSDAFAQVRRDNTELTNEKAKEIMDRVYMTTFEILEGVGD